MSWLTRAAERLAPVGVDVESVALGLPLANMIRRARGEAELTLEQAVTAAEAITPEQRAELLAAAQRRNEAAEHELRTSPPREPVSTPGGIRHGPHCTERSESP